jgi:hypothetical protein
MAVTKSRLTDLVVEHAEQVRPEKPAHGAVRVDPAEEILANKLCALLADGAVGRLFDGCRSPASTGHATTAVEGCPANWSPVLRRQRFPLLYSIFVR